MGLWIQQDIAEVIARVNQAENPEANVLTAPVKRLIQIELASGYVGINAQIGGEGPPAAIRQKTPTMELAGADTKIPDQFTLSPTGRSSNGLYDVIHVKVKMDVDSAQLSTLLEHLRTVNFMTVLSAEVSDVDEYELLREGYIYGPGDTVRLTALIETIWLREWTIHLMPQAVRHIVGADE